MCRGVPEFLVCRLLIGLCLGLVPILIFFGPLQAQTGNTSIFRNTDPSVTYVGSQSCGQSGCHEEINREYFGTPHGEWMAPANSPRELTRVPKPVTVFNQKVGRYYVVYQQDGAMYQAAYELDSSGHKVYHVAHKLDYVAGGENTGYSICSAWGIGFSKRRSPTTHLRRPGNFRRDTLPTMWDSRA